MLHRCDRRPPPGSRSTKRLIASREMRRAILFAATGLLACGGGQSTPPDDPMPDAVPDDSTTDEGDAPPQAALTPRLALEHPTIPAMTSPSGSVEARLDAVLFVRGTPGTELTMVVPVAHELDWTLTAADGTTWQPMFLPPPMPRPGGPPTTTVQIPSSGEVRVGVVHGISGFQRPGASDWQEGLPAGTYQVLVAGFDLGDGVRRAAPPMTLTVR